MSIPGTSVSWWELNLTAEGNYQRDRSPYLAGSYDKKIYDYDAVLNQIFTLDNGSGLKAELIANYNGPAVRSIFKTGRNYQVDASIKMDLMGRKATLRLAANYIFASRISPLKSVEWLDYISDLLNINNIRNAILRKFAENSSYIVRI